MLGNRSGFTLVEVSIALVLGGLVLGLVFAVGNRLGKQLGGSAARTSVIEQLDGAAEVLPIDLRGLSAAGGDIVSGETRDSTLQLRQTIANVLVCAGSASTWTVAPYFGAAGRSLALAIQDGDTAWLLTDTDAGEQWRAVRLRSAHRTSGACAIVRDAEGARVFDVAHLWEVVPSDTPAAAAAGATVRLTRPIRFSFYRASDGHWYLGMRSWNSASLQFNGVQPVSGPFAPVSDRGTRFLYFDTAGDRIPPMSSDTRGISRIEAVLHAELGDTGSARESVTVVAALRNRR